MNQSYINNVKPRLVSRSTSNLKLRKPKLRIKFPPPQLESALITTLSCSKFPPVNRTPSRSVSKLPQLPVNRDTTPSRPIPKRSSSIANLNPLADRPVSPHQLGPKISKTPTKARVNASPISKIVSQATRPKELSSEEYLQESISALKLIKQISPVDLKLLREKYVIVPKKSIFDNRKTVIFDLDETLVHCCAEDEAFDVKISITLPNSQTCEAGINIRPYALECLKNLSKQFEVFIFTASHSCYADAVCDYLDPLKKYISQRFYRQNCVVSNGIYIKDLRIFRNRSLSNIVIIENSLHCVAYHLDNCIPILSWYSDKSDRELVKICSYIQSLADKIDVRSVNKENFNLTAFA